jgi:galactose-1-phosphate uridylyltransferase
MPSSPNVRLERDTKKRYDQTQDWAVEALDVGKRAVTADLFTAAVMDVVEQHPDELLAAIRRQWEIRRAAQEE